MKYYYSDHYGQYYNSTYSISELPLNKPVWGFAYSINDDTEDKRLICLPVQGEIHKNTDCNKWSKYCFSPYKKGTNTKRKSGVVDFNSRMYADTYEEAVEMFNELVQQRIDNLYQMAEKAKSDMIKNKEANI